MNDQYDLAHYLMHYYGICMSDKCECIKGMWMGTACANWKSCNCKSHEELKVWQNEIYNNK